MAEFMMTLMSKRKTLRQSRAETVAVLDIGSSKVACFIAEITPDGNAIITGIGHQLSKGIRSGQITDVSEAEASIVSAVHAAEQMADTTVENIVVSVSGSSLFSRNVCVELSVTGEGVSERDLSDILREGRSVPPEGETLLHEFATSYYLDGARGIRDPRGMIGDVLGADLHLITAPNSMIRNLNNCVSRCHLNVAELIVSSHAAALSCLEPDEMDLGSLLIEMGGGVTGFSVFQGGRNIYTDAVALGGQHVTSDIALGLSTSLAQAERLKTLHGNAITSSADQHSMIDVPQLGEDNEERQQIPRSMLVGIIRPRLEEIFELIRSKLDAAGIGMMSGRRIVLTGGASQLMGMRDLAARLLGRQVRLAKPHMVPGLADSVSGPAFSAAVGMIDYMKKQSIEDRLFDLHPYRSEGISRRMNKMLHWVKENL